MVEKEEYLVCTHKGVSVYQGGPVTVPYICKVDGKTYGSKNLEWLKNTIEILTNNK